MLLVVVGGLANLHGDDQGVTFLVTSDSHYEAFEDLQKNEENKLTIAEMNRIHKEAFPERIGGGPIGRPRGVIASGDLIDDGDRRIETVQQWKHFISDFGLDGTDGLLKYPVFEGIGNHDGPPEDAAKAELNTRAEVRRRNKIRQDRGWLTNVCDTGLHYSWDWGNVHLVQLNLYPGDQPHPETRYNPKWHHPEGALSFLKQDLKEHVGDSGRPVVVTSHYGFDCAGDWWHGEELEAAYDAMAPYNVAAYFHGHTGTKLYQWKPQDRPQAQPLRVVNTGQTTKGFFVVQINDGKFRVSYRTKSQSEPQGWEWRNTGSWPATDAE